MFRKTCILDIGNCNTKILCSKNVFGKPKIVTSTIVKTLNVLSTDGSIINPKELFKSLKKYIAKAKEFSKNFEVILSSPQVIVRTILANNAEEIFAEASKNDLDKYAFDYKIIGKDGNKMSVMLVFIPKAIIESYLEFFKTADMDCKKIDFVGNCLAKSKFVDRDGVMAIIDIGSERTNAIITKNGKFQTYRSFAHGGANMTNNISKRLKIDFSEAEKLKCKNGINTSKGEHNDIDQAIKADLDVLLDEIASFFNLYAMSGTENRDIGKIVLVGGCSLLRNLDEYMMKKLSIPTIIYKKDIDTLFAVCGS